jgi:predicted dehydrogenase
LNRLFSAPGRREQEIGAPLVNFATERTFPQTTFDRSYHPNVGGHPFGKQFRFRSRRHHRLRRHRQRQAHAQLKKVKQAQMVAFCDIEEERARQAAEEYGEAGPTVHADYRRLLDDKNIDVVHVCTPNDSHAPITIAALEAGKHVMCEKPMAKTADGARQMRDAAKRTGKKLTIGYQSRQRPDSQYLYNACRRGDLGEIYFRQGPRDPPPGRADLGRVFGRGKAGRRPAD